MTPPPVSKTALKIKKSYVYLLRSLKDKKFYLGWTTDLQRRLDEHNGELSEATKSRVPFEMVYYETYNGPELAKEREHFLKKNPRSYFFFKKKALLGSSSHTALKQVVG